MSDSPTLIGRNRAPQRVHSLGNAVPTMPLGRSRSAQPAEKVEPKSAEQLREEAHASRDAQPAVTRCALCEDFVFEGTVGECREAARGHREAMHAAKPKKKTRRENLHGWKQVDDEQRDEAMKTVMERRAFLARSEAGLEEAAAELSSGPDGAASSSSPLGPAQQSIIDYLAGGPRRLFEVASHQGTQPATVGKTLHRLSERGLVVKRGRGVYELAGMGRAA